MLKWARENGCPWDSWVCYYAVDCENFEMLKWAVENECSLDNVRACVDLAKSKKRKDIVEYLIEWCKKY